MNTITSSPESQRLSGPAFTTHLITPYNQEALMKTSRLLTRSCLSCLLLLMTLLSGMYGLQAQTLLGSDIDGQFSSDQSGQAVSLSSDGLTVAIGAQFNDDNGTNSGHVRIFRNDGSNNWFQLGANIPGEAANDYSGMSVSLSADGNTVAIGAFANDGTAENSGHVRIYSYDGSNWIQKGSDINGKAIYHWFGHTVSLSNDGEVVAVGAPTAGTVGVYGFDGTNWSQLGSDLSGDGRGVSLSGDGNRVAVGTLQDDVNGNDSGKASVYEYNGSNWIQLGGDLNGEAAEDRFGWPVSLNSDGNILAVGAPLNDGNGTDSGHVRVFQYNGSTWSQLGTDIDGEAAGDQSGQAISLSGDGAVLAIGAIGNDGNGADSGHVRVYSYTGGV